jgi:hypothetical protein
MKKTSAEQQPAPNEVAMQWTKRDLEEKMPQRFNIALQRADEKPSKVLSELARMWTESIEQDGP